MKQLVAMIGAVCGFGLNVWPDDILDELDQNLVFATSGGNVRADVSFMPDFTVYSADSPAPGLLFSDDDPFFAPRLAMFVDAQFGERVTVHTQVRADRGFDPGLEPHGELRFDEYFVRASMLDEDRLNLRIGKFATNFGGWVPRHLAWENPLITAPLIYEDVMPVTDRSAPASLAAFAGRRNVKDNKPDWVPVVWGPSYSTGVSLFGSTSLLDFDVEIKNASLSSRPDTWDVFSNGFQTEPTVTGRIGWRPTPEWAFGSSYSSGPYMQQAAEPTLPDGDNVNDFPQTTFGFDVSYAHHRLQVWGELISAKFDVARAGEVEVLNGYVEVRYKFTPQVSGAARWNQSWYDDLPGVDAPWDRDVNRLDVALGYRFSAHIQTKLQYSAADQAGQDTNGQHQLAAQIVLSF